MMARIFLASVLGFTIQLNVISKSIPRGSEWNLPPIENFYWHFLLRVLSLSSCMSKLQCSVLSTWPSKTEIEINKWEYKVTFCNFLQLSCQENCNWSNTTSKKVRQGKIDLKLSRTLTADQKKTSDLEILCIEENSLSFQIANWPFFSTSTQSMNGQLAITERFDKNWKLTLC